MKRTRTHDGNRRMGAGVAVAAVLGFFFLLLLPFLPLILALIEAGLFGTSYTEDACRALGVHDLLGKLYRPIIEFFMQWVIGGV